MSMVNIEKQLNSQRTLNQILHSFGYVDQFGSGLFVYYQPYNRGVYGGKNKRNYR